MIIYRAINTINGKKYIGKTTKTLEKRIKSHKYRYKKTDTVFYRAIRKYGFEIFEWEVVVTCENIDELNNKEIKYISENVGGYNTASGGNGGDTFTNNPNKEMLRENVSKFHKGKELSEEHKNKISESHKGKHKPWASDTAKTMSEGNIGKESKLKGSQLSEEHKNKISKANKGKRKVFSEEHKENLKKAKVGFKNPNKGKTYEEIMGVEKATEFRKKQRESRKGRVVSEETKRKISESLKKRNNGK